MLEFLKTLYQKLKDLKSLLFNIDLIKEFKINKVIGNIFKYENNSKSKSVYNIILPPGKAGIEILQALTKNQQNNIKEVSMQFQQLISEDNTSEEQKKVKLSDPDFVETLIEAYEISKTISNVDKRKVLSDLIYKKFKAEDEDESNMLSQSIRIMKNLTKNHLKLNALFYLFRSGYLKEFSSAQEFINFYNKYLTQLTDIPHDKLRDIGTAIIGNGCAVTYTFGSNVSDFFDNQIVEYIAKLATKENISDEEENQKNIIDKLNNIWFQTGLKSAFPTAIGKCLGKTYLHDILGLDIIEKIKSESNNRNVTHNDLSQIYKYE